MQSMPFDPEIDRKHARLAQGVRQTLLADTRRINIVGASGWIGRTTAALLYEALGAEAFSRRVACFGSRAGVLDLDEGLSIPQRPLAEIAEQEQSPTLLFNLAFLTMDKIAGMAAAEYVRANQALSETIISALEPIGVDRLFVASSGAAAFADDAQAASDLRLYGGLKRDDESAFASWALAAPEARRTVIARIYSVSGPWINKHEVYALANFILDSLDGRPVEVRAPMRVWRSYVAVREVVSLVLAALLANDAEPVTRFDTGGEPLELGDVGAKVVEVIGGEVRRAPITGPTDNRYVGDDASYARLLGRYGISHLPLVDQIAETAAYLARQNAVERVAT
ncbi:MAG: NAD-dependent epimerase/dehydratase family protein [Caulobacter sp.]|nr:NAD-dependent epimerase/dehydratase family protein [Caulobacter sp.]